VVQAHVVLAQTRAVRALEGKETVVVARLVALAATLVRAAAVELRRQEAVFLVRAQEVPEVPEVQTQSRALL
jgi:hypothetical protein